MNRIIYNISMISVVIICVHLCLLTVFATLDLSYNTENVIFIKDIPKNEETGIVTGKLEGDGSGRNADNPLIPIINESCDSYLNTALYQATEKLKNSGGIIVVMGKCHFSDMDVHTAEFGENKIVFTSFYDGVDYRKTQGAKIILDGKSDLSVNGSSVWENITIETTTENRVISFNGYKTEIGNNVECRPSDVTRKNDSSYYVSLCAGSKSGDSYGINTFMSVNSGTYNKIVAGPWGEDAAQIVENSEVQLFLGGNVRVLGLVSGTAQGKCDFGGNVNITINGGTYECNIVGVFGTGMTNTDGAVNLKINGGKFSKVWSICDCGIGIKNNPPLYSVLDFSEWKGEISELAYAYTSVNFFNSVVLPDGVTADELKSFDRETTEETVVTDTQTVVTDSGNVVTETDFASNETNDNDSNYDCKTMVIFVVLTAFSAITVVVVCNKKGRKNS